MLRRLLLVALLYSTGNVWAYEASQHQYLTFLAARQFNHCVGGNGEGVDVTGGASEMPRLTPLEVRYMARANVGLAETNFLVRMFRWNYYEPAEQAEKSVLWLFETRFHKHFNELVRRLERPRDPVDAYQDLGRLLGYVQLVSAPSHAVPIYTGRFWRFSLSDRFDSYPIDEAALEKLLEDDCSFLDAPSQSYLEVLRSAATATIASVQDPIPGMPTTWQAFWRPSRQAGEFGEFGDAGNNFGRRTEFRCGGSNNGERSRQRCVLLGDDPLYAEFALQRHAQAVRASLQTLAIMQKAPPLQPDPE